ncbi:probable O-methyltransferase 3 [Macadamia integrifolia]|uniref:probable O-methyltransferase 3 n=1 Tax=Macadamia integrifolia TaxID=60698 RepID=UPI001C4EE1EA|nr:probable O-methyltransferase 3 [Macadamia integrifolia]
MDEQMQELTAARMSIIRYAHGFMDSMSLKCVVELGIPDILRKNAKPITLQDLAAALPLPAVNMAASKERNTKEIFGEILSKCGSGLFEGIGSIVDVGGGNGEAAKEIVKEFPSIKCTVFDLPQMMKNNSEKRSEVEWVERDMFNSVPRADAIILKYILHDWNDEKCMKILQQCKEAIPVGGKVIIVEMVIDIDQEMDMYPVLVSDMLIMVGLGGKQRTREEWEKLIHDAGYSKCKITPFLPLASLIEAYP